MTRKNRRKRPLPPLPLNGQGRRNLGHRYRRSVGTLQNWPLSTLRAAPPCLRWQRPRRPLPPSKPRNRRRPPRSPRPPLSLTLWSLTLGRQRRLAPSPQNQHLSQSPVSVVTSQINQVINLTVTPAPPKPPKNPAGYRRSHLRCPLPPLIPSRSPLLTRPRPLPTSSCLSQTPMTF